MNDAVREYGGALFALAEEEGLLRELLPETETVCDILLGHPEYIKLLASPEIPASEREAAVASAFAGAHAYLLNFLRMMVSRGYAREISGALSEYARLCRGHFGIALAVIRSATELTDAEKTRLTAALSRRMGKEISPEYRVEPELIGGLSVEVDGVLYDGTLRRRLDGLRAGLDELTL